MWTVALFLFSLVANAQYSVQVDKLRCDYLLEPLGVENTQPRFSWLLDSEKRDVRQVAYRIMVSAGDPSFGPQHVVWDSGERSSASSMNIRYQGKGLTSQATYYWKVMIRDNLGAVSSWSKPQKFHTGFLNDDGFNARWIKHPDATIRSPLFRKSFKTSKKIRSAYVYATAIGLYELYVNGVKASDRIFEPAITQFSDRILYSVYDITEQIGSGDNVLGVWMGEGASAFTEPPEGRFANINMKPSVHSQPMLLLELKITYTDGNIAYIRSDESWKCGASPIVFNNFYGGEEYDARLEKKGWNTAEYDDKNWLIPRCANYDGKITFQALPPVKEGRVLEPTVVLQRDSTVFEYDFGVTIGGYWQIEVEGMAGASVIIRGTEKCGSNTDQKPLTPENQLNWEGAHHNRYFYRDCYSKYMLSGGETESYKPRFFFQGFRYLQVTVSDPNVVIKSVKAIETGHFRESESEFSCSDSYLNQLHNATIQTFKNNFIQGVPLSNPNSEKYGWTGDVHLFAEVASYHFDLPAFWTKWLQDIADSQQWAGKGGLIPETVPELRRRSPKTDLSWVAVYPLLVWQMVNQYADTALVRTHYESLKKWYQFTLDNTDEYISGGTYGDHLIPSVSGQGKYATPEMVHLINTAYLYRVSLIMERMASMLNKTKDEALYSKIAERIFDAFNTSFYDTDKRIYQEAPAPLGYNYALTSNLISLQMGLVPSQRKAEVLRFVKDQIRSTDYRSYTGILGTKALVDVFQKEDPSFLYQIMTNQEFPGWGYLINQLGATTLNQNWDGSGDYNHSMFGSIDAFFFRSLLGINPNYTESSPFITIDPYIPENLSEASGKMLSPFGTISSGWEKRADGVVYTIEIPVNMCGRFYFQPDIEQYELDIDDRSIISNNRLVDSPSWLKSTKLSSAKKELLLGSGTYKIKLITLKNN